MEVSKEESKVGTMYAKKICTGVLGESTILRNYEEKTGHMLEMVNDY